MNIEISTLHNGKPATIRNFVHEYLNWLSNVGFNGEGNCEDTVNRQRQEIKHLLKDPISKVLITDINYQMLLKARARIEKSKKANDQLYSAATLNKRVKVFNSIIRGFYKLYDIYHKQYPKMPYVQKSKFKTQSKKRRALSIEEVDKVLKTMKSQENLAHFHLLAVLGFATGARVGELLGLHWSDFDFANNCFEYKHHVADSGLKENRKGNEKSVVYPMNEAILAAIENHRRVMKRRGTYGEQFPMVFPALPSACGKMANNGYTSRSHVNEILTKACIAAGVERFTAHDMRRTLNTELMRRKCDPEHIRSILGHKSPDMTQHYAHLGFEDRRVLIDDITKDYMESLFYIENNDNEPPNGGSLEKNDDVVMPIVRRRGRSRTSV